MTLKLAIEPPPELGLAVEERPTKELPTRKQGIKKSEGEPPSSDWVDRIHSNHGPYPCYAIPLLLPFDENVRHYLKNHAETLDLISSENCLLIALGRKTFKGHDPYLWGRTIDEGVSEEYYIDAAKLFQILPKDLPCLIVFEDIRSNRFTKISLGDMTTKEIDKTMRGIFSTIEEAVSKNKSPVDALVRQRNKEEFRRKGQWIISGICEIVGMSIGKGVEIFLGAWFGS